MVEDLGLHKEELVSFRARDVDQLVKSHGYERGLYMALTTLAERHMVVVQNQKKTVALLTQVIDIVNNMINISDILKENVEKLQKRQGEEDELTSNN